MKNDANNPNDILDYLIDSVIILDRKGRIEEINQASLNLLSYKNKEDLMGKPMQKVCKEFFLKEIKTKIPLQDYEMIYLNSEKIRIPVNVNITARRDSQGKTNGIISIARDIRKIKDLINELTKSREGLESSYTELQESKDELVRTEKLVFTGRIAANIAHEIRNPLSNVSMPVQQLKKSITPENPKAKHIEIVERNTERINHLITELLNCARPPKLNPVFYNMRHLLKNILEVNKQRIVLQKIKVSQNFTSKSATIKIDRDHVERALANIIRNAIDAMPDGGNLTSSTELNKDLFMIKVQDTGRGIPEKDILMIFDPFFSTKPGGVGLGLTVCYGIIVSHGGTIEVESKPRIGSTFTVSLPRNCQMLLIKFCVS